MALVLRWITPPIDPWQGTAERLARTLWKYRRLGNTTRWFADGTQLRITVMSSGTIKLWLNRPLRARYQFFGSLERLYKRWSDSSYAGYYFPQGNAVSVEQVKNQVIVTPLISSITDPGSDGGWPYHKTPLLTDRYMRSKPFHHPDGLGFRQWFAAGSSATKKCPAWLMTSWQQALPLAGLGAMSAGSAARSDFKSLSFERGPTVFAGSLVGALKTVEGSDWPGQAALCQAEGRWFVITVDANNDFFCYPVASVEQGIARSVSAKRVSCPWPEWVTSEPCSKAALDAGVSQQEVWTRLRPMWAFNRAGTRAACIAAHRLAAWADTRCTSSYYREDGVFGYQPQEDLPGIVEVEFAITIRGDDFEFSVRCLREIDPRNTPYAPVAVGYLLRPIQDWPVDTLMMLNYQHFTDVLAVAPPETIPEEYDPARHPPIHDMRRPTKKTVAQVLALDAAGEWREVRRWLAYYACYPLKRHPRFFTPKIEEFPEMAAYRGQADYANHWTYICHINAMDLSGLAFSLSPTISTIGAVRDEATQPVRYLTYAAESAGLITIVWNQEVDRQRVGHPVLQETALAMFDGVAPFLDAPAWTALSCAATARYAHCNLFVGLTDLETATRYQWMSIDDPAFGTHPPQLLVNAAETKLLEFLNFRFALPFAQATDAAAPLLFSYFDGVPVLRPGLCIKRDGEVSPEFGDFDGYPIGALHHSSVVLLTTHPLSVFYHRFSLHPDGSWSQWVGPIAAKSVLYLRDVNGVKVPLPPDLSFEQSSFDRIVLRSTSRDANGSEQVTVAETSHAEAMRSAFRLPAVPVYRFDLRIRGASVQFRPASDDPTPHGWYDADSTSPLGIRWITQSYSKRRWLNQYGLGEFFETQPPYQGYSSALTFPCPRMEGGFVASAKS